MSQPADPFGLWNTPPQEAGGGVSFSVQEAEPEAPGAVWSLDASGEAEAELAQRASRVALVENGLAQADGRMERFLAGRKSARVSFGGEQVELPDAEQFLSLALDSLEPPGGAVSFGLGEHLVERKSVNWTDLRSQYDAMVESANRLLLHFVWVDTRWNGGLAARTTVGWDGDLSSCFQTGLASNVLQVHRRSLSLAMASRSASLRTLITTAELAGKLALLTTTPLGAIQALALAWQFVDRLILPQIKQAQIG